MLYDNITSTAKILQINFDEISKRIKQTGTKGDVRESILVSFIGKFFPNYEIKSGIVINSDNIQSNQEDIIIYDHKLTPLFISESENIVIPIESAKIIIEVKSNLDSTELAKALDIFHKINEMKNCYFNNLTPSFIAPNNFLFAYNSSITIDTILTKLRARNDYSCYPTSIIILNRGLIYFVNKNHVNAINITPTDRTTFAKTEDSNIGNNLMFFYLLLMAAFYYQEPIKYFPDVFKYAANSGFINPTKCIAIEDAIGCKIEMGGELIEFDKFRDLYEYFNKLVESGQFPPKDPSSLMQLLLKAKEAFPSINGIDKMIENLRKGDIEIEKDK